VPLRVLHLIGSPVSDFFVDLSRVYAQNCLGATADADLYESVIAEVTPDSCWRFAADLSSLSSADPLTIEAAVRHLRSLSIDVVVPQMFCLPGMTTYRSLLELLDLPYVGNRPDVMALGAHKARARAVGAAAGVRVPEGELLRVGDRPTLTPPVVVKPVQADNSMGIALVETQADYGVAIATALQHDTEVLVERYIELGREVRCGVLERDGVLVCLPLEEYAVGGKIRSYDDKLARSGEGIELVAKDLTRAWIVDVTDPVTQTVWDAARTCHRALGCRDYSLFDFRIDADGQPWFLEAGLYCSFATTSVISTMALAAGIPLTDLFADALAARC
jgi:D-alanine-D-alanine ligase